MTPPPFPFDTLAPEYDAAFTSGAIGGAMRRAVWRRVDRCFAAGDRVLELNCGTGEDALHLAGRGVRVVATDRSPGMLEVAREKIDAAGAGDRVTLVEAGLDRWAAPGEGAGAGVLDGPFDGVLSNFGGLNCVASLAGVAAGLADVTRAGARAVLCVMGPWVPWEWGWYLLRGDTTTAFRRLGRGGVAWRGITVRYPSLRETRSAFAPWFRPVGVAAVGALVPPTFAEAWARRHPRVLRALDRWERRLESVFPLPHLADHYVVELERVG